MLKNVLIYDRTPDPAPRSPALTVLPRCADDRRRLTDFLLGVKFQLRPSNLWIVAPLWGENQREVSRRVYPMYCVSAGERTKYCRGYGHQQVPKGHIVFW